MKLNLRIRGDIKPYELLSDLTDEKNVILGNVPDKDGSVLRLEGDSVTRVGLCRVRDVLQELVMSYESLNLLSVLLLSLEDNECWCGANAGNAPIVHSHTCEKLRGIFGYCLEPRAHEELT